ncbi:hypothetical protein SAMN04488694_12614 [Natrinema hispanicum]|uniref:Uncharacterized protein n=1 Tax=Natrinema hispanicum TaxID=392421 RepID=A0A1I0IU80_9EURY|nr:hypothetical protein SAMN04488694_12614 [Natrinema hispanicum]
MATIQTDARQIYGETSNENTAQGEAQKSDFGVIQQCEKQLGVIERQMQSQERSISCKNKITTLRLDPLCGTKSKPNSVIPTTSTMSFKYSYTQQGRQQARANEKHTRRWGTLEPEGRISGSCTFLHISLPDDERWRCVSRPDKNAVYAREKSVFSRFVDSPEVGQ